MAGRVIPGFGTGRFKSAKLVVVRGNKGYGILAIVAVVGGSLVLIDRKTSAVPTAKKKVVQESPAARAAGFNAKGEATLLPGNKVKAILSAGGPMHSNEVIRFEAATFIKKPDGTEQILTPRRSTFSEKLIEEVPVTPLAKGSKVIIRGNVFVYRREDVKVEREMESDGFPKLYLNTGYVKFKRAETPNGPRVLVTCTNLKSVHEHGMEFLSKDKKTVSARIMFTPGDQIMDRENIPFMSKQQGLEPITINQLIPKRTEPIELTVPISGL